MFGQRLQHWKNTGLTSRVCWVDLLQEHKCLSLCLQVAHDHDGHGQNSFWQEDWYLKHNKELYYQNPKLPYKRGLPFRMTDDNLMRNLVLPNTKYTHLGGEVALPTVVMALSKSYHEGGVATIKSVQTQWPSLTIVVYDLGLSPSQIEEVSRFFWIFTTTYANIV